MTSSGTSIPAFLAASRPTTTAPLTDVSASVAFGEYRQAPFGFPFCEVIAARTASSSAWPIDRGPLPSGQRLRSSTAPYASASASMAKPWWYMLSPK